MLHTPPSAVLIFNPESGRMRRQRSQQILAAQRELGQRGIAVDAQRTTRAGEATELTRSAVEAGAELIIVCGGDGTINEAACGMALSQVPLAVLPAGTANVLAREIGMPLSIPAAARALVDCQPRRISLGCAGSRYFLLMAGVGFDASVVRQVNAKHKKLLGMTTYIVEALRQALFQAPAPFVISGNDWQCRGTFVCIAKAQHYGPVKMVREADLFSDSLYIYCFQSQNRLRYFRYALALLSGSLRRLPDVSYVEATEVCCKPSSPEAEPVFLQVDGEFAGQLPCCIKVVPDALTILVPERTAGSGSPS